MDIVTEQVPKIVAMLHNLSYEQYPDFMTAYGIQMETPTQITALYNPVNDTLQNKDLTVLETLLGRDFDGLFTNIQTLSEVQSKWYALLLGIPPTLNHIKQAYINGTIVWEDIRSINAIMASQRDVIDMQDLLYMIHKNETPTKRRPSRIK